MDEEETENIKLDNKIELYWRMFFEGNKGGVNDEKEILSLSL